MQYTNEYIFHSGIYIAPLLGNYSEVLQTLARSKEQFSDDSRMCEKVS